MNTITPYDLPYSYGQFDGTIPLRVEERPDEPGVFDTVIVLPDGDCVVETDRLHGMTTRERISADLGAELIAQAMGENTIDLTLGIELDVRAKQKVASALAGTVMCASLGSVLPGLTSSALRNSAESTIPQTKVAVDVEQPRLYTAPTVVRASETTLAPHIVPVTEVSTTGKPTYVEAAAVPVTAVEVPTTDIRVVENDLSYAEPLGTLPTSEAPTTTTTELPPTTTEVPPATTEAPTTSTTTTTSVPKAIPTIPVDTHEVQLITAPTVPEQPVVLGQLETAPTVPARPEAVALTEKYAEWDSKQLAGEIIERIVDGKMSVDMSNDGRVLRSLQEVYASGKASGRNSHTGDRFSVSFNEQALRTMLTLADSGLSVRINSLVTGNHAEKSAHWLGDALDLGLTGDYNDIYAFLYDNAKELGINRLILQRSKIPGDRHQLYLGQDHRYKTTVDSNHNDHIHVDFFRENETPDPSDDTESDDHEVVAAETTVHGEVYAPDATSLEDVQSAIDKLQADPDMIARYQRNAALYGVKDWRILPMLDYRESGHMGASHSIIEGRAIGKRHLHGVYVSSKDEDLRVALHGIPGKFDGLIEMVKDIYGINITKDELSQDDVARIALAWNNGYTYKKLGLSVYASPYVMNNTTTRTQAMRWPKGDAQHFDGHKDTKLGALGVYVELAKVFSLN